MKSIKFLLPILIGSVVATSCMDGGEPEPPRGPIGLLVTINAYDASPSTTFHLDGTAFTRGRYPSVTGDYVDTGSHRLTVTSESNASLADTTFKVKENTRYTSIAYGTTQSPKHVLFEEEVLEELNNRAAIRFIHTANGIDGNVDFYIGDHTNEANKITALSNRSQETKISINNSKNFILIDKVGTFDIWIKDQAGNKLDSIKNASIRNNAAYSLQWFGTKGETGEKRLRLVDVNQ